MAKKYFLSSDIHSFYSDYKHSLSLAGFDINNPDHILVILGDLFDRGNESVELFNFIYYIVPKDRRILIRGNHEQLLQDALDRGVFYRMDSYNGTAKTLYDMAMNQVAEYYPMTLNEACDIEFNKMGKLCYEWINSEDWVDFYEIGNKVLVHSFIPLHNLTGVDIYDCYGDTWGYKKNFEYFSDWRTSASKREWKDSRWGCPWKQYQQGLFDEEIEQGKTLICGHWHSSDFFKNLSGDINLDNDIYIDESRHIIALDSCTPLTHKVNVLVLDEDGNILKVVN